MTNIGNIPGVNQLSPILAGNQQRHRRGHYSQRSG